MDQMAKKMKNRYLSGESGIFLKLNLTRKTEKMISQFFKSGRERPKG